MDIFKAEDAHKAPMIESKSTDGQGNYVDSRDCVANAEYWNDLLEKRLKTFYATEICEDQYHEVGEEKVVGATHQMRCIVEPLEEEKKECRIKHSMVEDMFKDNLKLFGALSKFCPFCGEKLK